MNDRRAYQHAVAQLLEELELQTQRLYRLRLAGARDTAADEELDETRRRLARLVSGG